MQRISPRCKIYCSFQSVDISVSADIDWDDRTSIPNRARETPFVTVQNGTQPTIQWVKWGLPKLVQRPGREAYRSQLTSAKVKNAWSLTYILSY